MLVSLAKTRYPHTDCICGHGARMTASSAAPQA